MVLVDSSCWIEASRKNGSIEVKAAIQGLLNEFEALLCGPVELEVLGGARSNERARLQKYFDILPYRASDHKIWRQAIATSWTLRDAGITTPWNDTIIGLIRPIKNINPRNNQLRVLSRISRTKTRFIIPSHNPSKILKNSVNSVNSV